MYNVFLCFFNKKTLENHMINKGFVLEMGLEPIRTNVHWCILIDAGANLIQFYKVQRIF